MDDVQIDGRYAAQDGRGIIIDKFVSKGYNGDNTGITRYMNWIQNNILMSLRYILSLNTVKERHQDLFLKKLDLM